MVPSFRPIARALSVALVALSLAAGDAAARPAKPKTKAAAAHVAKSSSSKKKAKAASGSRASKGKRRAEAKAETTRERTAAKRHGRGSATTAKATKAAKGRKETARARRVRLAEEAAERRAEARREAARDAAREAAEQRAAVARVAINAPIADVVVPDLSLVGSLSGSAEARPFAALSRSASSMVDQLVDRARSQLGTRYVFGGNAPGAGLDCSSFARYAMEALGFRLPRTANQQAQLGRAVPRDPAALKPGDLLTFGTRRRVDHVGIYLGEGRFIHASVKSGQVIETTINRNNSLFRKWLGARRLIAGADSGVAQGG
jgi:cell wall-associated NlpC family hydrolase